MSVFSDLARAEREVGALVAKHETAQSFVDYTTHADDPEGFIRDVLHGEPWSRQVDMAFSVRDNGRTLVMSANGIGKDWLVARAALWWVYARRGFVVLTSVTERQVKHILMREVRRAFTAAPELPGELFQLELRVDDGCGILAFTSDSADRLVGFHHPRLLICLSEGQGIDGTTYEAAHACATAPGNRILAYGNPTSPTGPFYQAATSLTWDVMRIRAHEHPNVVSGRQEIPGAVSREWIAMMADEYGETSSIYRSRVLAEFPEESIEGLIKREWLRAAFAKHENLEERGTMTVGHKYQFALDVARLGPDSNVLAVLQGPMVHALHTWHGVSTDVTVDRVIDHARRITFDSYEPLTHVDEPGLGGGVIDQFAKRKWPVSGFNGASAARDPRRFLNVRAESHWAVRDLLERGKVALPRDPLLEEEALAIEWQLDPKGRIQMLSKDSLRSALGRSPDRFDSVVIGLSRTAGALALKVGAFRPIY